ncbi:MAG: hypothetical protein CVV49_02480 [Spirochaetae bacterium HGW-Spirochaetae-5]|nr:MAG: hypothetical protein CVV49_02480 [Spirochaetae bacterium HGW-Spirochaetae-5]
MSLTVIMPVYNCENYIKAAIDSILNQTFFNFTLLIINDGSTDNTEKIIFSYTDRRITYLKNENNMGIVYSRNRGIANADSVYLAWMDADDIAFSERLQKQFDFLENNHEYDLCFTNIITINKNDEVISKPWFSDKCTPVEWDIIWSNPIPQPSVMLRKKILVSNDLIYDEELTTAEDYDLWTRISLNSKIARLDDVLLLYRKTEQSAYHMDVKKALDTSILSNYRFIENLTGEEPPFFHIYLTQFHQVLGYPVVFVNIILLKKWMDKLIRILGNRWDWDQTQLNEVKKNSEVLITNYLRRLDKRILLKNIIFSRKENFYTFIQLIFSLVQRTISKIIASLF